MKRIVFVLIVALFAAFVVPTDVAQCSDDPEGYIVKHGEFSVQSIIKAYKSSGISTLVIGPKESPHYSMVVRPHISPIEFMTGSLDFALLKKGDPIPSDPRTCDFSPGHRLVQIREAGEGFVLKFLDGNFLVVKTEKFVPFPREELPWEMRKKYKMVPARRPNGRIILEPNGKPHMISERTDIDTPPIFKEISGSWVYMRPTKQSPLPVVAVARQNSDGTLTAPRSDGFKLYGFHFKWNLHGEKPTADLVYLGVAESIETVEYAIVKGKEIPDIDPAKLAFLTSEKGPKTGEIELGKEVGVLRINGRFYVAMAPVNWDSSRVTFHAYLWPRKPTGETVARADTASAR